MKTFHIITIIINIENSYAALYLMETIYIESSKEQHYKH